jgi:uncharacterized protein YraI
MRKNLLMLLLAVSLLAGIVPARSANAETPQNDWQLSTGSVGNTHFAPINVSSNLTEKYRPVAKGSTVLAVYNNRLYTMDKSTGDTLYAIDLVDNTVKWQFKPDGDPKRINDLSVKDGLLYLAMGTKLYAVEDTGNAPSIKWSTDSGIMVTYGDSALFSLGSDNKVKAVDLKNGSTKWEYALNQFESIQGKMASGGGKLFFTVKNRSDMTYKMFALDSGTGEVLWTTDLYGYSQASVPVYQDGKLYLDLDNSTNQNPKVYVEAFDATTGNLLWKYDLKGSFEIGSYGPLSVNTDSVFTVNSEGYLIAINKDSGAERWKVLFAEVYVNGGTQQDNSVRGPVVVTQNKIFLVNHSKIKVYDTGTGSLLETLDLGATAPYAMEAIGHSLLFVSDGANLFAYGFIGSQPETVTPADNIVGKTIKNANMRKGPGAAFAIVQVVPSGSQLTILGESGGWYNVQYRSATAAVSSGYITKTLVDTRVVAKTLKNANFRTKAEAQSSIIQVIPAGSPLTILSESGDWFKVEYAGNGTVKTGYIAKSLVDSRVTGKAVKNTNLRTGPGGQYGVTKVIPAGANVSVYSESNGWYRLEYRDPSGTAAVGYAAKYLIAI